MEKVLPETPELLAPYSPAEFHDAVFSASPRTAVFDCDGTLWGPDSGFGFMRWSLDQGMVAPARHEWMERRYALYEAGTVDEATICGEMVQLYASLPETLVREAAAHYVQEFILPHIFPSVVTLARELAEAGAQLWAVSSTCNWVVEAGLAAAGIGGNGPGLHIARERILAAEVAIEHGLVTDRLLAVPTDEAKADALQGAGLAHPDAVFGNSLHDAAMLAIAGRAYPVNPSPGLVALAAEQGWRAFQPASSLETAGR